MVSILATRCPPLPFCSNSTADKEEVDDGVTVTFTCFRGHYFSDGTTAKSITCQAGRWSQVMRGCERKTDTFDSMIDWLLYYYYYYCYYYYYDKDHDE